MILSICSVQADILNTYDFILLKYHKSDYRYAGCGMYARTMIMIHGMKNTHFLFPRSSIKINIANNLYTVKLISFPFFKLHSRFYMEH